MRLRQTGSVTPSSASVLHKTLWETCANSTWSAGVPYYDCPHGSWALMEDEVTKGYFKRKQRGEIFFNPMHSEKHNLVVTPGDGLWIRKQAQLNCSGVMHNYEFRYDGLDLYRRYLMLYEYPVYQAGVPYPIPSTSWLFSGSEIGDFIEEASTAAQAKRGASSSNLWETVAEVDKSLTLLGDILEQMKRLTFANARNGQDRRGNPRARAKALTALWLIYRYGVMPLIHDANGIIDGLSKRLGRVRETSRGQVTVTRTQRRNELDNSASSCSWVVNRNVDETVTVRAMSLDEYVATVSSNIGFSTKGFLMLPWELTGYSFVLDWVVNVGDFLGALLPAPGVKQLGSCVVVKRENVLSITPGATLAKSGFSLIRSMGGGINYSQTHVSRSVGLPSPNLVVKADFKLDNLNRCLDAVSLITQRIPRYKSN